VVNTDGALELISLPTFDPSRYEDVVMNPGRHLRHDYFVPGGTSGVSIASFPYTASILRGLNHFHVRAELLQVPWYLEFYEKNHPSGSLELTAEILAAFYREALGRGKTPVVTIIPTGLDLVYFVEHGRWPYQNLIVELSLCNIQAFNFGPGIIGRLNKKDPCTLFDDCSQHYNQHGYRVLAELSLELLRQRGLLEKIKQ
jgi:hypothetical protein